MDACTFCGSAAADRAFLAEAKAGTAAICNVCLAVQFRRLEYKKGLEPSRGVNAMIGEVEMWPGERRLRQLDDVVRRFQRKRRATARPQPREPLFQQHVHPLRTFEKRCAMCDSREQLVPTPKGARICEPCVIRWTRTLLG